MRRIEKDAKKRKAPVGVAIGAFLLLRPSQGALSRYSSEVEELPERFGIAANYWGEFTLGRFANLYAQYWTQNQYTDEDRYGFPSRRASVVNDMWEDYYFALHNLQEIKRINRQDPVEAEAYGPNDNQVAIAHILQAFTAQVMTDIWGPIPFTEALRGEQEGNNVPYDPANWQEVLGTQKWLALYMQGVQGWSEWRRLDFGVLEPPAGDILGEVGPEGIALRLTYPVDEANLNERNLSAAVNEILGGDGAASDNQGVRVWWDVD